MKFREAHQHSYWEASAQWYRPPDHPVVQAYTQPRVERICAVIGAGRGKRLLDVGTGNGAFLVPLSEHFDVCGIDTSPHMLARNPLRERCTLGDALQGTIPPAAYDVVFAANTLHHLPDPPRAAEALGRLTREWLVFVEPNRYNPLMFTLAMMRADERQVLAFCPKYMRGLVPAEFELVRLETAGMIPQNHLPRWAVPFLRPFDRPNFAGMTTLLIARRRLG